jgi:hypothetical protein
MHISDCGIEDLADFLSAQKSPLPRGVYAQHLVQLVNGTGRAVRESPDQPPVAIAGLFRFDDGRTAQAWFMADRQRVSRSMVAVAAGFRRALREVLREGERVAVLVKPGNRAGEIIAAYAGFAATSDMSGEGRIWILGGENGERSPRPVWTKQCGESADAPDPRAAAAAGRG